MGSLFPKPPGQAQGRGGEAGEGTRSEASEGHRLCRLLNLPLVTFSASSLLVTICCFFQFQSMMCIFSTFMLMDVVFGYDPLP